MLPNPSLSLSNPPSPKNPKSGPQRTRLDIIWDKKQRSEKFSLSCRLISLCLLSWSPSFVPKLKQQDLGTSPTPGGMPSRSKQQFTLHSLFSSPNNLPILHPYPSIQIGFCSVLWSIFFFCPTYTSDYKKTKFTMVKWPSDPITNPKGEHTRWWVDWYFSVAAQPWLCCKAASLLFSFQWMTEERSGSRSVYWGTVIWHR